MSQNYYNHIDIENEDEEEEDYIDMEVSSFTHFFPEKITFPSPQHAREFEFHMSFTNVDKDSTPSPADELFYKGKLLPLHLPPRLQMVEKLLKDSPSSSHFNKFSEVYGTPLGTNTVTTPATSTPFESCNISPVESCQVSRELKPEEYFGEQKGFILLGNYQKLSWSKKLKIKITKIKALFGKSACSDESADVSGTKIERGDLNKVTKKNQFGLIPSVVTKEVFGKENEVKEENICHRRSFSGAFKRRSLKTKASSSSSSASSSSSSSSSSLSVASSNSSSLNELLLKRSSSANSEIETSLIQGAIAHCKQSQQTIRSRKTLSEVGCHSFPSRLIAFDDQASEIGLCRG
ncbi:putative membrane-associated kinase regulator 4 [Silene latifolia]|uniref:putative membrane-associated kinase regulator 4 n=1 Tax=Silene latifolia TaxID=37657 RepID=UPI003D77D9D1